MPQGAAQSGRRYHVGGDAATPALPASHPVLTVDDLVAYLRLPKSTVYKLAQGGRIPGQKIGRHRRFHKEAIDMWLEGGKSSGRNAITREGA